MLMYRLCCCPHPCCPLALQTA